MSKSILAQAQNALPDVASKKALIEAMAYAFAFIVALCTVGLAITFRESVGEFGWKRCTIGFLMPALLHAEQKCFQGQCRMGNFISGSITSQLSAATALTMILIYRFETSFVPLLREEAKVAKPGTYGTLTTNLFAVPNLIFADKTKAVQASLCHASAATVATDTAANALGC